MSLYKYLPPERIDVLESGSIAVSLPTERNDPFDELVAVDADTSDEELQRQYAKQHLQIPFEEYKTRVRIRKSEQSGEMAECLRGAQAERFGAICLSRVWDSIPMWSYYAHRVLLGCRIDRGCKVLIQQNLRRWGFEQTALVELSPNHEHFSFVAKELALPAAEAGREKYQ